MSTQSIQIPASDGYALRGTLFLPSRSIAPETAVILNSATGVHRRFYARFATYLAEHYDVAVLTYDYRGIADSRPRNLRTFEATIRDWPQLDMPAALNWVRSAVKPRRLVVIGHSAGGNLVGLIPGLQAVDGIVLVGAQLGYWRLWPRRLRYAMAATWYVAVPGLSRLFGYVPGWLGAGQHWPRGIASELARWCRHPEYLFGDPSLDTRYYADYTAPLLAWTFSDDPHATRAASEHLLVRFPNAQISRRHVHPADLGIAKIGHFGFFRSPCERLWRECAQWILALPETSIGSERRTQTGYSDRGHSRANSAPSETPRAAAVGATRHS